MPLRSTDTKPVILIHPICTLPLATRQKYALCDRIVTFTDSLNAADLIPIQALPGFTRGAIMFGVVA